ncbi:hypothetical protein, partial [Mycoplasmopsis synoviae]
TGQIKNVLMSIINRIANYNRLLAIEEELSKASTFPKDAFYNLKK